MCIGNEGYAWKSTTTTTPVLEDPLCPVETLIWRSDDGREVSIRCDRGGLTAAEFVDELVQPLMLACTYHPHSVDEALGRDDFADDDAKKVGI